MEVIHSIKERSYAKGDDIDKMYFPNTGIRGVAQMIPSRDSVPKLVTIPNSRVIVNRDNDHPFAVVTDGYQMVTHQEVIQKADEIVRECPEWGTPTREAWMSNYGGRLRYRHTFNEIDFEIRPGDVVHPTLETFASYDTSLAQREVLGGFRVVCVNGATVGKLLAEYKRKHTASLDLEAAKRIIVEGMRNYSIVTDLWKSLANRAAFLEEVNAFEGIGFNKNERIAIEREIREQGTVKQWDDQDKEKRQVDINAWDLYNIYTAEATHRVPDLTRQARITTGIANTFVH